jgi:hypothetical protein
LPIGAATNWLPLNYVSIAGFALMPEIKSCGRAMLVPAIPPEAGMSVLRNPTPNDSARAERPGIATARKAVANASSRQRFATESLPDFGASGRASAT